MEGGVEVELHESTTNVYHLMVTCVYLSVFYLSGGEHCGVDEVGLERHQGHWLKPEGLLVEVVLWKEGGGC